MNDNKKEPTPPSGAGTERATKFGPTVPLLARRVGIYLAAAIVIFLLGLVPMWFKTASRAEERDAARRELRVTEVQLLLATAAVEARRGEYEPARQTAAAFFTALRSEVDLGEKSAFNPSRRAEVQPLLEHRDTIITLLARSDPASAERLSSLYVELRKTTQK